MIAEADAEFLLSERGRRLASQLYRRNFEPTQILPLLDQLRKEVTPSQASALLSLVETRQRAGERIPHSERLFFTPESLEQSTSWEIAQYRAHWIHERGADGPILDLGCGIGGDMLALARLRDVIAFERDPVRARFARENAKVLNLEHRVTLIEADWTAALHQDRLPDAGAAYADPARRRRFKRIFDVEKIEPPLSTILQLQRRIPFLCVKLMPGIRDGDLPNNSTITFISQRGVCKEAMLWIESNAPAITSQPRRRAAICEDDRWIEREASQKAPAIGTLEAGMVLHEPDPALIRAGAFHELCRELDAWLFDPQIAYVISSSCTNHPLTRAFRIEEIHPFNLKKLNQRLGVLNIGQVELKKRGAPFEPEQLRHRLKLNPGGRSAVIFFTRQGSRRIMLIAKRLT